MAKTTCFKFGQFQLLPAERQLLVNGKPAAMTHRAFDVLVALVERAGQLVSKNDLLDTVWRDLIVEEGNLVVHISALRKILGPDAIATIPGRGYRFCAALEQPTPPPQWSHDPLAAAMGTMAATPPSGVGPMGRGAPPRWSKLIGRQHDVELLLTLLKGHRLVTVTGAGGVGKTHLAHAVAELSATKQRDGVLWIELAALSEPTMIPATIARAMGKSLAPNVPPLQALIGLLKPLSLLMVLDNAEHLQQALAALVTELAGCAADVRFLVTSQVRLNVPQEQTVRLSPLTLPDHDVSADEALEYDAVALFVARVQALERRFNVTHINLASIVNICRRLDGIALALELAAARVPSLGVQTLSDLLDERFRLLTMGSREAPTRQHTLTAAFEWSHGLLSQAQQALFRRLSVLAGGFTLDELMPVAGVDDGTDPWDLIDLLADLVERSLITVDAQQTPRYGFLESAHAFAQQKLAASDEERMVRQRHLTYFHDQVEQAGRDYTTLDWPNRKDWLQTNYANIRAALSWSLECENDVVGGAEMVAALADFWHDTTQYPEAERWLNATSRWRAGFSPLLQARLLLGMGGNCLNQGRYGESKRHYLESLSLFKTISDRRLELGEIYNNLAVVYEMTHAFEDARRLRVLALDEYRRTGDRKGEGVGLANLGMSFLTHGPVDEAVGLLREAVAIARETPTDPFVGVPLVFLSESLLETGQVAEALTAAREAATLQRSAGAAGNSLLIVLRTLARIELANGDIRSAANHLAESLEILKSTRHSLGVGLCLNQCAEVAVAVGETVVAAKLLGFSAAWLAEKELSLPPNKAAYAASILTAVESSLGTERCDAALAEGATLVASEALALGFTAMSVAGRR